MSAARWLGVGFGLFLAASRGPALFCPEGFRAFALALVGGLAGGSAIWLAAAAAGLGGLGVATAVLVGRPRGLFDVVMWLLGAVLVLGALGVALSPAAWWGYSEQLLAALPVASLRWAGALGLLLGGGLVLLAVAGRDP